MGRLGVLGGTFDPVHIGHLVIAVELRHRLSLDRVLFVPAGDPPHKPGIPVTSAEARIAMLQLALRGRDGFGIDRTDVDRAGPSYTVDLLRKLQERFPDDRLVFLMGEDSLRDLHTWRDPEGILQLAEIGVGCRPGVETDLETVYAHLPAAHGRIAVVDVPLIEISARDLRRRVAAGEPIAFQVPEAVEEYVIRHGLYRSA